MPRRCRILPAFAFCLFLLAIAINAGTAWGQPDQPVVVDSENSFNYHGYEAVFGFTTRSQALIVFDGTSDKRLAAMVSSFSPSPQIFLNTPFRPFRPGGIEGETAWRSGYYMKYSYNSFSLDRQEDPDTGGIGGTSSAYNYGTKVDGYFLAAAPVAVSERIRPDGTVPFRMEFGMGLGYLDLSGDIVLGDWMGDPDAPVTRIDDSSLALFLFTMGRHQWGALMFGYQFGFSVTSSNPYSYSQGYLSLDIGYKVVF